jgi:hypothetical protein
MILLLLLGCLLSFLLLGLCFEARKARGEYVMAAVLGLFISIFFMPLLLPILRLNFRLALGFLNGIGLTKVSSFVKPFEGLIGGITLIVSGISTAVFVVWLGNRMNQNSGSPIDPGETQPGQGQLK